MYVFAFNGTQLVYFNPNYSENIKVSNHLKNMYSINILKFDRID